MNYIVLDMEWNQPFKPKNMIRKPVTLYGEIVQIGAVKLDENYHIVDTFKILVKPVHYSKMCNKVAKLTKITNQDLEYGLPFPVALKHFRNWCTDEFVFLTWGENDVDVLRDNIILHGLDPSWLPCCYNIQLIFNAQVSKEQRQYSLSDAMEMLGQNALPAHDALHDARNTVTVCMHLDMVKGLAEYNATKKMNKLNKIAETLRPDKFYPTRTTALEDAEILNFYCPICGENVICEGILKQNTDKYICIGKCESGDEFFVRFKFTKWPDESFSVSRIIYEMDEDHRNYYNIRKQHADEAKLSALQYLASKEGADDGNLTDISETIIETINAKSISITIKKQ